MQAAVRSPTVYAGYVTLLVLLLAYILSFVDRQILSLLVDPIKQDLALDDVQMGLLQGVAFALLYAIFGLPFGLAADRLSRKWMIVAGIVFWSLATGLCGLASSFAALFGARLVVGLGEAVLAPAAHSLLAASFPPEKLGRAMGIYAIGISLGAGLALLIGSSLIAVLAGVDDLVLPVLGLVSPWQSAFFALVIPGLVLACLVAGLREPVRSVERKIGAGASIRVFAGHLADQAQTFVPLYVGTALLGVLSYSMLAWYPTFLHRSFAVEVTRVGHYLGVIYLTFGSAGSIFGGWIADRLMKRGVEQAHLKVILTIALLAVPFAVLAPFASSFTLCLVAFAPLCCLANGYFGCASAAVQLATPSAFRGISAALFLFFNSLVAMSVGAASVPLVQRLLGGGDEADLSVSLAITGATFAALAAMTIVWGLTRPASKRSTQMPRMYSA